ncbi:hypothetical protein ACFL02_09230, partial [Planctomycetota bacterium]
YGLVMGSFGGFLQAVSSGVKVPALLILGMLICFPAFFIIQYALGSRLGFWQLLMINLSGFVVMALIMVAFAPIVAFFVITGGNYSFLKLLHVIIFAISGIFGMKTVLDALRYSCEKKNIYPKIGVVVFRFWIIILAFVGMQLAWNLRPYIGRKDLPFELFRQRESNIYIQIFRSAATLAGSPPVMTILETNKPPASLDKQNETNPKNADPSVSLDINDPNKKGEMRGK